MDKDMNKDHHYRSVYNSQKKKKKSGNNLKDHQKEIGQINYST